MNPEYKNCPFCDEEIKINAIKCKHCGEYLDEDLHLQYLEDEKYVHSTPEKNWSPGIAALLSFFIPGAGQIYKGNIGSGIGWLIFVGMGYAMTAILTIVLITAIIAPFILIPTIILHLVCVYYAATKSVRQKNIYGPKKLLPDQNHGSNPIKRKKGVHPYVLMLIIAAVFIIAVLLFEMSK